MSHKIPARHSAVYSLGPSVVTPQVTKAQLVTQLKNKQWLGRLSVCLHQGIPMWTQTMCRWDKLGKRGHLLSHLL